MSGTKVRRITRPGINDHAAFDLAYVRTGPMSEHPLLVIPGGPGLGSIAPYRGFRRWAAKGGLDVIMVEHRGIGASRYDLDHHPLTHDVMRIRYVLDDLAAVLDAESVSTAYVVGSSYGSYLASSFGVAHPTRVAGMVLDSALQSTSDIELERQLIRALFWNGSSRISADVRHLAGTGVPERELLDVVRAAYELGGDELVAPLLRQRVAHHCSAAWRALSIYATRDEGIARIPGHYEFDIAGAIGFRELNYGAQPDGLPLDPALTYAPLAHRFPAFAGEPFDLPALTPGFTWPIVTLAGSRDVRTPPEIAERVASTAQSGTLVEIENGHSALDTHPAALLNVMREVVRGTPELLPGMSAALNRLPRRGLAARMGGWLQRGLSIERTLRP